MVTAWTLEHAKLAAGQRPARLPLWPDAAMERPREYLFYWDMWPVQDRDGRIADVAGRELWMILTAPDDGDPDQRHFKAKIHWLERKGDHWIDLGPVLPEFGVPYEREWSGSALWDEGQFTLWFTGAGQVDRPGGYQQALYETSSGTGADGLAAGWSKPRPILGRLTSDYIAADAHEGEAGRIKAYRDPFYFRDPADGRDYLVFTASSPSAGSEFTGAVGLAARVGSDWQLLPPLIRAGGVNNELERACLVVRDGAYFAFWATQAHTFAPAASGAPTGLYGMVADSLRGPYRPLNGSGLVLANPAQRPQQAYSWSVTQELVVSSFVDVVDGAFVGAPAPLARLTLDAGAATATLVGSGDDA
ncbi:glycoside hydrolase family 68 protein [Alteriqipengyuania sp. WL0013]|uniref:glycoside hydrolase family 68 protein n=1 Tax=Alteriqipengyuania sp. WL0013 TaxID=3110773 RepID=UPI002B50C859|nr:glycoside hydrolase family 68 protein [Alteriqipengyuania sp. WL0013]MEB3415684.1 glycoside hydrolase family 68 protein [Alteriqipengyuania sp. WL0013]